MASQSGTKSRERSKRNQEGQRNGKGRAFRGLLLTFLLTFLNLAGLLLTATGLGILGEWTAWQFAGLYGVVEMAAGIASLIMPNIWHMPVAELETSGRTRVQLAASTVFLPHWGAAARCLGGGALLAASIYHEGVSAQTILLVPLILSLAVLMVSLSLLIARAGVAKPDIDVVQLTIKWNGKESQLPGISIGASLVQFLLSLMTLPVASLLTTSVLYQPEFAPSAKAVLVALVVAAVSLLLALLAWSGRIAWKAPMEQQVKVESEA